MTELECARAYLTGKQRWLAAIRRNGFSKKSIQQCEQDVLAGLSWVWDAQCRADPCARHNMNYVATWMNKEIKWVQEI